MYTGFRRWVGILRLQVCDHTLVELFLRPVGERVDLTFGNSLGDKELLNPLDTAVRQALVVLARAAHVRVRGERKLSFRIVFQVFRELARQSRQNFLLT